MKNPAQTSSNNKTLNARQDFVRSLTEFLTPAFINNKT
jgi:hypothetical protein